MKKFLSGFLVGAILFSSISVFAASYVAEQAGFKIFVNGKEFKSDPPAVVIDGRTYLPIGAIGDALGVKVEWNSALGQVEVGQGQSYSRTNPAPVGVAQTISGAYGNGSGTMEITVTEIIKGNEAKERVAAANQTNPKAESGYEYLLVKVKMKATGVTKGTDLMLLPTRFAAYSNDAANPSKSVVVPNPKLDSGVLTAVAQGEENEGFIVVQIKEGDKEPKLVYNFENDGGIWFKLQ